VIAVRLSKYCFKWKSLVTRRCGVLTANSQLSCLNAKMKLKKVFASTGARTDGNERANGPAECGHDVIQDEKVH